MMKRGLAKELDFTMHIANLPSARFFCLNLPDTSDDSDLDLVSVKSLIKKLFDLPIDFCVRHALCSISEKPACRRGYPGARPRNMTASARTTKGFGAFGEDIFCQKKGVPDA
jgi:hypothetical protein